MLRSHGKSLADDMIVADGEVTSYSVVISPPGQDRTFWHCTGANDAYSSADVSYDNLGEAKVFHFGYPPSMSRLIANNGAELADMFRRVRRARHRDGLGHEPARPDQRRGETRLARAD